MPDHISCISYIARNCKLSIEVVSMTTYWEKRDQLKFYALGTILIVRIQQLWYGLQYLLFHFISRKLLLDQINSKLFKIVFKFWVSSSSGSG